MAESREDQIARLLREGLEHYGTGQESLAIDAWEKVLAIDPNNEEARDFLQTADRSRGPEGIDEASLSALLADVRGHLLQGNFEAALTLLESGSGVASGHLELEGLIELCRVHLLRGYRSHFGDLSFAPCLSESGGSITEHNLPTNAGFLISLIDGVTTVNDLITLSGMDTFDALRTLRGLVETRIVEMPA